MTMSDRQSFLQSTRNRAREWMISVPDLQDRISRAFEIVDSMIDRYRGYQHKQHTLRRDAARALLTSELMYEPELDLPGRYEWYPIREALCPKAILEQLGCHDYTQTPLAVQQEAAKVARVNLDWLDRQLEAERELATAEREQVLDAILQEREARMAEGWIPGEFDMHIRLDEHGDRAPLLPAEMTADQIAELPQEQQSAVALWWLVGLVRSKSIYRFAPDDEAAFSLTTHCSAIPYKGDSYDSSKLDPDALDPDLAEQCLLMMKQSKLSIDLRDVWRDSKWLEQYVIKHEGVPLLSSENLRKAAQLGKITKRAHRSKQQRNEYNLKSVIDCWPQHADCVRRALADSN